MIPIGYSGVDLRFQHIPTKLLQDFGESCFVVTIVKIIGFI